jgi:hypothetical protein
MAEYQNKAAWLPGVGKQLEIGPADVPEPGPEELLIEVSIVNKEVHLLCSPSTLCTEILITNMMTGQSGRRPASRIQDSRGNTPVSAELPDYHWKLVSAASRVAPL